MTDDELYTLIEEVSRSVADLPGSLCAATLYEDAALAARRIPAPLGSALRCTLALQAERRRLIGLPGLMGEPQWMVALAIAVLEYSVTAGAQG